MKQLFILMIIGGLATGISYAQDKKEQDIKAIKSMCGCYEVKFNFAETFQYSEDSTYKPSAIKHAGGLEWVELVEDGSDKIVMQHLLIVGPKEKPHIVKHWRQDWLYENTDLYQFEQGTSWKFVQLSNEQVKGQWTQKVYQVDDSPRYEGSSTWIHVDGKSFWENTTDAPLPRREYTKRNDYNVTVRGNRHEITAAGWNHDQDNLKVIRAEGQEDIVLAEEKGLNTYTKVEDSKCQAAQDWWSEHAKVWAKVRTKWDEVFTRNQDLTLKLKVEDKRIWEHLFALEPKAKKKKISEVIDTYVVDAEPGE